MDYKEHTKQRFFERFKNKSIKELTDDDYKKICDLCRKDEFYLKKSNNKMVISYNNIFMWCVLSKKSKIVKTIYPIDKSDRNKIYKKLSNNGKSC